MHISATIKNSYNVNEIAVTTDNNTKDISIPSKQDGFASSVNGAEFLMLSIATCFCNDIYREAGRRNIAVSSVEVTVQGEFAKEAEAGSNITYSANVVAPDSSTAEIAELMSYVDDIAEIHNTLRQGIPVVLKTRS